MKAFRINLENGQSYITDINQNCPNEEVEKYFVGKYFNFGNADKDIMIKCIAIEEVIL